jgi:hypothetical protein
MFRFRPQVEGEYWTNNWFSNAMAYISKTVFPLYCQTEEHWTVRFMDLFWTDCACCLFIRGIVIGYLFGLAVAILAIVVTAALI